MDSVINWIIGLSFSIILGHLVISSSLVVLRRYLESLQDVFNTYNKKKKICLYLGLDFFPQIDPSEKQVPYWVTGLIERSFFTIVVAFDISGTATAMIGWITVKMLASKSYKEDYSKSEGISIFKLEFAGLLGNLGSMLFALLGGLIIKHMQVLS
jgi:hypothetical protein